MRIVIKEVTTKKQFNAFVDLPYRLFKGNPYFVPPLRFDEAATLRKDKNPAFDYCEARYWLAYKGERVVGRIAAIINHAYIEKWKNKYIRFGWIDFEEDEAIAKALMNEVEEWAKEKGLTAIHGPLGFTDLDHEGMLVEGFDQVGTLATVYNHPYYPEYLEKMGFVKDADWVEYKVKIPNPIPDKMVKMAEVVQRRYKLQIVKAKKAKDVLPYVNEVFQLLNIAYSDLYGVVPLTEKQIAYYTKQYFGFIKPDFVSLILDENDKLIAFLITMPSLSKALQKAGGGLFPFGFIHILKALKKNDLADLYLIAIDDAYQGKGVNALLIHELAKSYNKHGVTYAESNHMLEVNNKVLSIWKHFDAVQHKRRRSFIKHI